MKKTKLLALGILALASLPARSDDADSHLVFIAGGPEGANRVRGQIVSQSPHGRFRVVASLAYFCRNGFTSPGEIDQSSWSGDRSAAVGQVAISASGDVCKNLLGSCQVRGFGRGRLEMGSRLQERAPSCANLPALATQSELDAIVVVGIEGCTGSGESADSRRSAYVAAYRNGEQRSIADYRRQHGCEPSAPGQPNPASASVSSTHDKPSLGERIRGWLGSVGLSGAVF